MDNNYCSISVKIRKRRDLDYPVSVDEMDEIISMVAGLLSECSSLEVLSVEPWWVAYEEAEGIDWGDDE